MKAKFSTSWAASKQPRKQRKYRYNAPLHIKREFLNAALSKELRKKHGRRSALVRKGDEAIVMRGAFKKKKAKVSIVDIKRTRVALEGLTRTKKDGTKVTVFFHPSKLRIVSLNLEDNERLKTLNLNKQEKKNASDKSSTK